MLASLSSNFAFIDWAVVVGYLLLTSVVGALMAGKQQTIRDFFLGGRKLPWHAVSGSIIATEISALTFVSVPYLVMKPGGNFTYLQLGVFGSFFARLVVAYWLVPAYYKREIYSPFDYMQNQLGGHVRSMVTVLFTIGTLLGQSARIYLTGEVLLVVLHDQLEWLSAHAGLDPLAWSIIIITLISLVWTLLGGMTTVIWTDVLLFLAFAVGALVALGVIIANLPGGFAELVQIGLAATGCGPHGKFTFFDWSTDPTHDLTIWVAVIASTWGGVGSYGVDQLLVQRMFCCKSIRDARWAIVSSAASQLITITVMIVGVGLYAYYQTHTMTPEGKALFDAKGDRVLPIFTLEIVPVGLKGVILAAIFAAAISTVMGVLTALGQTAQTAFYNPLREAWLQMKGRPLTIADVMSDDTPSDAVRAEQRHGVFVSRVLIVVSALILGLLSYWMAEVAKHYPTILQLGLAMAQYVIGALIAGFALAFFPLRIDGRGFMYSGPLSVMMVYALVSKGPEAKWACMIAGGALLLLWLYQGFLSGDWGLDADAGERDAAHFGLATLSLLAGIALVILVQQFVAFPGPPTTRDTVIAWTWRGPIGSVVAFVWGYLLARRRMQTAAA